MPDVDRHGRQTESRVVARHPPRTAKAPLAQPLPNLHQTNDWPKLKYIQQLSGPGMATVNFSVPDDLKTAFSETFEGYNKSAVVATLMREAIDREQAGREGKAAVERILARRRRAPAVMQEQIRATRLKGRA